ncbi:helix-turn-helix domain-containing protein [Sphingobacterium sp. GVS05A]|uniref:helix-turn-helix domain-containing protein n=1 Tax=Sphingobacterium sp. GVS05A TaxID=2862679 RepID=UPI001CBCB8B0|nr:helix-turn-helix domain-containing protein [Sphingobacterium sp. GVS05A]
MIEFRSPQNEKLLNYIEGYYYLSAKDEKLPHYLTFPNNYTIVTFIKNGSVQIKDEIIHITKSEGNSLLSVITQYKRPLEIRYLDPVEEITLYLKPGALACLFPEVIKNSQTKTIFDCDNHLLKKEFNKISDNQGGKDINIEIEKFLANRICSEIDRLLVDLIKRLNSNQTISEISFELNLSRQYISNYFKDGIGKSPTEFRTISRFRNAIKSHVADETLTKLTYENSFFDQAHFNKYFKLLTSYKPKDFFKQTQGNNKVVWLII